MEELSFTFESIDDHTIVARAVWDLPKVPPGAKNLLSMFDSGATQFVVDISNLPILSSVILGKIIIAYQKNKGNPKTIRVVVKPELAEVFYITKLDHLIQVHTSIDAALQSFSK